MANDSWSKSQEPHLPNSSNNRSELAAALSRIEALHGDGGVAEVIAAGAAAIPPLRDVLLDRERSGSAWLAGCF